MASPSFGRSPAGGRPAPSQSVGGGVLQRPERRAGPAQIEQLRMERVVAARGEYPVLIARMDIGLGAGEKPRADPDPGRTERQRRRDPAPVGDAAGGQNRKRGHRVDHLRHQRHRAEVAANMAAGVAPLGDDQVEAGIGGPLRLVDGADHLDCRGTCVMHAPHVAAGIAPEERDDVKPMVERDGKLVLDRKIQHEIRAIGPARQLAHLAEQQVELLGAAPGAGQVPDAAGLGHGRRHLGRCNRTDRRLKDRLVDAEQGENVLRGHMSPPLIPSLSPA